MGGKLTGTAFVLVNVVLPVNSSAAVVKGKQEKGEGAVIFFSTLYISR